MAGAQALSPSLTVAAALARLSRVRVLSAPVLDPLGLLGFLSVGDVLRAFLRTMYPAMLQPHQQQRQEEGGGAGGGRRPSSHLHPPQRMLLPCELQAAGEEFCRLTVGAVLRMRKERDDGAVFSPPPSTTHPVMWRFITTHHSSIPAAIPTK